MLGALGIEPVTLLVLGGLGALLPWLAGRTAPDARGGQGAEAGMIARTAGGRSCSSRRSPESG